MKGGGIGIDECGGHESGAAEECSQEARFELLAAFIEGEKSIL